MSSPVLVYLLLGAAGSGRREVLADLIEGGIGEGEHAAVLLAETEAAAPADARLGQPGRWRLTPGHTIDAAIPPDATRVFFVTDGRRNPIDQIEAFKAWLEISGAELARILCVVHCRLVEEHPPLVAWYEACIHFSDVVLLNRRDGVANKWLTGFMSRFEKKFYPCLFEFVKAGRVDNPVLVLDPQARRMTHAFDNEPEWVLADEDEDDEAEAEVVPEEDPYLAQHQGGRRIIVLPDIAKFTT